jgi:integrase
MSRGSITKRGASSWRLTFDVASASGGRKQRTCTVHGTKVQAEAELRKLLVAKDEGTLVDPSRQTVGEYMSAWLNSALDRSPKTLERYQELAARQVLPHLGSMPLQKLKPEHLSTWHAKLIDGGLSAQTVVHAHRVLSLCLKRAVESGTLTRNVAAVRKPPKVEAHEVEILTPDQVTAVLAALSDHWLHPIASLALATGMRRGELLALQWSEVDLDRAVLRVERSVEETKAGLRTKPPKTKRGRRNIGLSADTVAMLREHRRSQRETRLAIGQGGQPVLVFSNIEGGMLSPNGVSRSWRQTCKAKKLPRVQFHALRHTHASTLIRAGVDVLTVSRRLGHSSPSMTLDVYAHLMEGADAAAVKAIEGVLK